MRPAMAVVKHTFVTCPRDLYNSETQTARSIGGNWTVSGAGGRYPTPRVSAFNDLSVWWRNRYSWQ